MPRFRDPSCENIKTRYSQETNYPEKKEEPCGNSVQLWKAVCDCVQLIIGPILFLCKDGAYSTEQEYRVLLPADIGDPRVQLATHMRESECAFRTYIQTENFLFEDEGYKILIGPKVKNKAALEQELRWRLAKLEAKTGISYTDNVEIKHSEIGYR